jgi:glycosyltransferase involved in cell wall biosynthesis
MANTQRGGHGRVWNEVIPRLSASAELRFPFTAVGPLGARLVLPPRPRPEVWLVSGHHGPWLSSQPVVSVVYEVSWHKPELRCLLSPEFAQMVEENTRRAVRDSDWVIVPAEASRKEVVEVYRVHPDRVRVVPLGVDLETFNPRCTGGRALVARARGGSAVPYVLFVGNVGPRKNLAAVRDAMVGIAKSGLPHCLVVVAGPAPDSVGPEAQRIAEAELPGFPDRLVRIRDPDDTTLAALMAGADAFCMPSLIEGFGLPVLEAMACGVAVVTSSRGSLPEVVGDTGIVVEPTAGAVEEALAAVLTDEVLRTHLGLAARTRAETMSWDRTAEGWFKVIAAAAGEAGRG